jgi:hypothetical protein
MNWTSPEYERNALRAETQAGIEKHRADKARERKLNYDLLQHRLWLWKLEKNDD